MRYKIDDSIVKRATKCGKDNACLKDVKYPLCSVKQRIEYSDIIFICSDELNLCNFKFPFGSGYICSCPVRIEIYKRYGK